MVISTDVMRFRRNGHRNGPRVFLSGCTKRSDIMSEHHIHVFSNNLDNNQSAYMDLLTQAIVQSQSKNQYHSHSYA